MELDSGARVAQRRPLPHRSVLCPALDLQQRHPDAGAEDRSRPGTVDDALGRFDGGDAPREMARGTSTASATELMQTWPARPAQQAPSRSGALSQCPPVA
jgi:hypothetical protein